MSAYTRLHELGNFYQDRVWNSLSKGTDVDSVLDRAVMTGLIQTKYFASYHMQPYFYAWSPFAWHRSQNSNT